MSEEDKQNEHDEQLMRDHWLSDLAPIVNSDDNVTPEEELPMSDKDTADILNEVSLRFPTKETTGERASDDLLLDEALAFGATADESQDQNAPKLSEDKMQILLGEVRKQFGERSENTERPTKEKIIPFKPIFSVLGVAAALVIGFFIFKSDNEPISLVGNSNEDNSMGGAIVLSFKGEAKVSEVERGERSEFRKLEDRDLLASGTEIETGEGGEAILLLTNGSLVTVGPTTRLKISQFNQEPFEGTDEKLSEITNEPSQSKILFDLDFGDLVVDVKKLDKKSSFNVQSQLGVAGIRGTQYRILATSESAQISVLEGKVSVESKMKHDHLIDSKKGILLKKDLTNLPKLASDEELNLIDQITKKAQQLAKDIKLSDLAEALDDLNDEFAQLGGAKYFVKSAANMEMIWCEPGTFLMGNPEGQGDKRPHQVRLTKGFYLGKYEVTQEEYEKVMGENPSKFKGAQLPVEKVNWIKAMEFCEKLTEMETKSGRLLNGWIYTLPTEAQWEYACRAGTTTNYHWGEEVDSKLANYEDTNLDKHGTMEVGSFKPNPWGFFDLTGNVREWCYDYLIPYTKSPKIDPVVTSESPQAVTRGGGWLSRFNWLQSFHRNGVPRKHRHESLGFRLCLKKSSDKKQASMPVEGEPWTVPSIGLEMNWCPPGTFMMGSPGSEEGRKGDETQHEVTLTQGFFLGKYEVTQEEYEKVMGGNPSNVKGKKLPVEKVNFYDAREFCRKLTVLEKKTGRVPQGWNYVLPTEAQWEYACRAGTVTVYSWGNDINSSRANYKWNGGPNDGNDLKKTRDVGQYAPNPWGLFDMHGNVWEWVSDWKANYPEDAQTDPKGPESGPGKVKRGGSWLNYGTNLRSAKRNPYPPSNRFDSFGFRLCLKQEPDKKQASMPVEGEPWTVPSIGLEMNWCPPGIFMMGSPEGEAGRNRENETQQEVTLTKGFFLGKYEVTQKEYEMVMWNNPSNNKRGEKFPVTHVNWNDAIEFSQKLTESEQENGRIPEGWVYTLPSSSEWEYACRAGTTTVFSWGNEIDPKFANYEDNNSKTSGTMEVGSFLPNPWGFFDMHGNVNEWAGYFAKPGQRGGSWRTHSKFLRSANRFHNGPEPRNNNLGFRLCLKREPNIKQASMPVEGKPWTVPSIGLEMNWCEPGTFMMGSPESELGRGEDEAQRKVTLTKGFYLGKYEVTQEEYEKVMRKNPSTFKGKKLPVEMVNWNDAMEFCIKLTELERMEGWVPKGWNYTLPTEAQWEYACRAGTATAYSWGKEINLKMANYNKSKIGKTSKIGFYQSNPWGLFDMHGNVWEWVLDWKANYSGGEVSDPEGRALGSLRVRRGGSWGTGGADLRSAKRNGGSPSSRGYGIGFRVAFQKGK